MRERIAAYNPACQIAPDVLSCDGGTTRMALLGGGFGPTSSMRSMRCGQGGYDRFSRRDAGVPVVTPAARRAGRST